MSPVRREVWAGTLLGWLDLEGASMSATSVNSRTGFQPVGEVSRTGFQPVPLASALPPPTTRHAPPATHHHPPVSRLQPLRGFTLLRLILGLILFLAAGLKAHQLATDPLETLAHVSPLPSGEGGVRAFLPLGEGRVRALAPLLHSRPFLIAVVECELLFGLVLLSGIFGKGDRSNLPERPDQPPVGARCFAQIGPVPFSEPKVTWALSLLCFGGFALISLYKGISGDASCGCFGRVPVNPWYTFGLDATAVLALVRWRPRGLPRSHLNTFSRFATIAALWLLVGTPVALATRSEPVGKLTDLGEVLGDGETVILAPERWLGKRFPLLPFTDVGSQLDRGEWLVILYRGQCAGCRNALPEYERVARDFAGSRDAPRVALVLMPPWDDFQTRTDTACTVGRVTRITYCFAQTPTEVVLRDGIVCAVRTREQR